MPDIYSLVRGQRYCVVRPFTDYDHRVHPAGETWELVGTNFLPYESGLTLHVRQHGQLLVYRLQWLPEEQGAILERFTEYVTPC